MGHLNTFIRKPRIVVKNLRRKLSYQYSLQSYTLESTYLLGKKDCKSSTLQKIDTTHSGLIMMSNLSAENISEKRSLLTRHYSSCLELHLRFVSFFCDPFPYVIPMHNCCACAAPAFCLPVSSSEPAFQRREIHKPFILSFIPFLPPPCL